MTKKRIFIKLFAIAVFMASSVKADLGTDLCQSDYIPDMQTKQFCSGFLIGTIEALHAQNFYCADGATSYGHIISTWRRLLKKTPYLQQAPTFLSMRQAIIDLDLHCK